MFRIYKYLLRPNKTQDSDLDYLLWQARRVYNTALEQRIMAYDDRKASIKSSEQWAYFRDLRNSEDETDKLGRLNARVLSNTLRRLDKAFQAFYRRMKIRKPDSEKPGYPHFKPRKLFNSIEFSYGNGCSLHQESSSFYVQNVGQIKVVLHRVIPKNGVVKMVVVQRKNDRWYANFMVEFEDSERKHSFPRRSVGIDVGIKSVVALSNKIVIDHPNWLKKSLAELRVLQRKAARQQKGSKRQTATYKKIAKLHEHVSNQRKDFYHKLSRDISKKYCIIGIEDLNLSFMNRNKNISRQSYDAGVGVFRQMLTYKAEEAGGKVIAVNPAYTSQKCSRCGHKEKKSLAVRVHKCSNCGLKLSRDVNAAKNIQKLAKAVWKGQPGVKVAIRHALPEKL